jgi:hypothetical protein
MANLAEHAKEGHGSKRAVLPMMIADNGEDILDATFSFYLLGVVSFI